MPGRALYGWCLSLALGLGACGPARAPGPGASVASESTASTSLTLALSTPTTTQPGHVVWSWLEGPSFEAWRQGASTDQTFVELIEAMRVSEVMTLGPQPQVIGSIEPGGPGGFVAGFVPRGGDLWSTLLGNPEPGEFFGVSSPVSEAATEVATVSVTLTGATAKATKERCTGVDRELVIIDAPEVVGEAGNEAARRLCVMVPEDYATTAPRRYPVVFLLPGFGGDDTVYAHLTRSQPEAILVGIDGRTRFGTTYFHDTDYAGAWGSFVDRVVAEVDARYRTLAEPAHRGLLGHSTGGYNAIALAMRRPDLFGGAAASSPDALDMADWLWTEDGRARSLPLSWTRVEDAVGGFGQMVSYAVQFDDASHPGAMVWPFGIDDGRRRAEVWSRWARVQPMQMLEDPQVAASVAEHLSDRLFISVGRNDAFLLFPPAEAFHRRLTERGIEHAWVPTDDGHFTGSAERREAGLAYLLARL